MLIWFNNLICVLSLISFIFLPHLDPNIDKSGGSIRFGLFLLTFCTGTVNVVEMVDRKSR